MLELFLLVGVTLAVSPLLLGGLALAYRSPRFTAIRILPGPGMQVPWPARMRSMSVTSTISLAMVLGVTWLFHGPVVVEGPSPAWLVVGQALAVRFLLGGAHQLREAVGGQLAGAAVAVEVVFEEEAGVDVHQE